MVDFERLRIMGKEADARTCPTCGVLAGERCVALGGDRDGWHVTFKPGERTILKHAARFEVDRRASGQ